MKFFLTLCIGCSMLQFIAHSQENKPKYDSKYKELMSQDWPNLSRYREQNEKLGAPKPDEKRVVFMGNSITDAWIGNHPDFFEGSGYLDRGISGQTTPQMLIRFTSDVIDLKPKVVLILAGTNDIAGNTGFSTIDMITDNIIAMAQLARVNGIKVILCSVLPAYDYPWRPGLEPVKRISELNERLRKYADKNNMIYLDYYSAMVDARKGMKKEYSEDGVHPNSAGYDIMEPLAEEAIQKVLGSTD